MKVLLISVAVIFFSGCAAIEQAQRASTERLLSAAGFQPTPANNAARQKSLAALTPYKIERKLRGNEYYYLYAVPEQNLVYFGNQEAYGKYQELLIQQEIANANLNAAQINMSTAQQWNDWGCWGTAAAILPPPRIRGY
ncbi:MAG: hypothetical protein ACKOLA_15100 [Spartobacteria bacterium]